MEKRSYLLVIAAGMLAASTVSPAHAIIQTQTVGPASFSTSGTTVSTSTVPISFAGFNTALGTLSSVRLTNGTGGNIAGTFGGDVSLAKISGPARTFTASAFPTFIFSNLSSFSGSGSSVTLGGPGGQLDGTYIVSGTGTQGAIATAGGSYSGTTSALATNSIALRNYFSGTPTINSYFTNWTIASTPAGGLSTVDLLPEDGTSATLSGQLYLTYEYDDGVNPVPGPLPVLGAGAAFGFSRKLRQRIRSSAG
jgi:hypothetical protein